MYICIEHTITYICIEYAITYICIEYASTYICSLFKMLKLVHAKLDSFQITNLIHTINSRLKVHW